MSMPGGRPSSFKEEYIELGFKYALLGADDKKLAELFGVSVNTIDNWKKDYPEFLGSLKAGKEDADAKVADSLYHRACGYTHKEVKVFHSNGEIITHEVDKHYPPDTTAIAYWLNNRRKLNWQGKANSHTIEFDFPENGTPTEKADAIINAVAKGEVAPDIGAQFLNSIKALVDIEEATELKERLERIEKALA